MVNKQVDKNHTMACNMLSSLDINESQLHLVKEDKLKKFFKVYIHLCKVLENTNWYIVTESE